MNEPEPIVLSASQIGTWGECQRKWAWKYIERIESEQTPQQKLGTEVENEQLQPYLLQGRAFEYTTPEGKKRESAEIAASALAYLPAPQTQGLEMQRHFTMPSPTWVNERHDYSGADRGVHSAVYYQGYIDLWHRDSKTFPDIGDDSFGIIPGVGDFKTTGDLKWAKNEEALRKDPQAMLYAMHALFATRAPAVDLGWIYMQTKGTRKAKRTKLRVFPDHVAEQFQRLDAIGQTLANVRRVGNRGEVKALDLPPSPEMCEAYGGCPYRNKCNLSPAQIIDAHAAKVDRLLKGEINMTQGSSVGMSMLDQLRAKKAAADQGAAPTAPSVPLLSSPMITQQAAAPHIVGVTTDGMNVYAHDVANFTRIGQYPDGRHLYMKNVAPAPVAAPTPIAAPVQAQPINPPESALAPAPAVGAEPPKLKRGRPVKTEAAQPVNNASINVPSLEDARSLAYALRDACDAFINSLAGNGS